MLICRPSGERGSRNTRNRHLRSSYCCSVYPAVRNSYRALLRSSSIREPSDPPLRVISLFKFLIQKHFIAFSKFQVANKRDNYKTTNVYCNGATPAGETSVITSHPLNGHVKDPESIRQTGTPSPIPGDTVQRRLHFQQYTTWLSYL